MRDGRGAGAAGVHARTWSSPPGAQIAYCQRLYVDGSRGSSVELEDTHEPDLKKGGFMRAPIAERMFPKVSVAVALVFLVGGLGCTPGPEPVDPDDPEPGDDPQTVPVRRPGDVAFVSA